MEWWRSELSHERELSIQYIKCLFWCCYTNVIDFDLHTVYSKFRKKNKESLHLSPSLSLSLSHALPGKRKMITTDVLRH